MYSIILKNGGKQYRISDGDTVTLEKMAFQLTIEDDDDTTLYDIHEMLLELFLKGLYLNNLPISDPSSLLRSLNQIQTYFNNIQVKINIKTYLIKYYLSLK